MNVKFKQSTLFLLMSAVLITGCSGSGTGSDKDISTEETQSATANNQTGEDPNTEAAATNNDIQENPDDGSTMESESTLNENSIMLSSELFSDESIEPLLANIQSGSPLSVTNHQVFLSAYYPLVGAQLLKNITRSLDGMSNEIRAALVGETSSFVTESVSGSDTEGDIQAVLVCPDGGHVAVAISTLPEPSVGNFTEYSKRDHRDAITYVNCSFASNSYNGHTTEQRATWTVGGKISSRRFGGYEFTDSPTGLGNSDQQFTITDSSGTTAKLYAQQSYADSEDSVDIQRFRGNWHLQQDDRSLSVEAMNISAWQASNADDNISRASVQPYFSLTGTITNNRVVTATNQVPFLGVEELGIFGFGNQKLTDAEGGNLNLTSDFNEEVAPAAENVLRIDTEGELLTKTLPLTDEMFLVF